jgi:hypothetical protein
MHSVYNRAAMGDYRGRNAERHFANAQETRIRLARNR